jgi:catechol 2,3-dioxygenase-like lactoylglutathione lyase family enzyme
MIDHVSIAVRDLAASAALYERVLGPLGYSRIVDRPATVGFGKRYAEFWLNARPALSPVEADTGTHICLRARDEAAVSAFFQAAMDAGCRSAGDPGQRQGHATGYFGAFILDPDGNKIEAMTVPSAPSG